MNRIESSYSGQELQHYLCHIRSEWDMIIGSDELRSLIDFQTVKLLQTRNPHASNEDRVFVNDHMQPWILFLMITDLSARSAILSRLLECSCMIPSLFTFFEDTKWLEPIAKVIRGLLPDGLKNSIRRSFIQTSIGSNQADGTFQIQSRNHQFVIEKGNEKNAVNSG